MLKNTTYRRCFYFHLQCPTYLLTLNWTFVVHLHDNPFGEMSIIRVASRVTRLILYTDRTTSLYTGNKPYTYTCIINIIINKQLYTRKHERHTHTKISFFLISKVFLTNIDTFLSSISLSDGISSIILGILDIFKRYCNNSNNTVCV